MKIFKKVAPYIIPPLGVLSVSIIGSYFTTANLNWYYNTLNRPDWTPSGSFIGAMWTTIFILAAISIIIFWKKSKKDNFFGWVMALFVLNGVLNVLWSAIWFGAQELLLGIVEMIILEITVIALIVMMWKRSLVSSILLFLYAGWVAFATYLAILIWQMNS